MDEQTENEPFLVRTRDGIRQDKQPTRRNGSGGERQVQMQLRNRSPHRYFNICFTTTSSALWRLHAKELTSIISKLLGYLYTYHTILYKIT